MSINSEKLHLYQEGAASVNANSDSFNFDLWARAVRRQMLRALNKKTTH